jgi:hypothetical protein
VKSGEEAAAGGLWVIMYGRNTPAPVGSPSALEFLAEPEPRRRTGVAKQCTAARSQLAGSCGQRARNRAILLAKGLEGARCTSRSPRTHSQLWLCWCRGCGRRRQAAAASQLCSYPVMQQQRRGGVDAGKEGVQARQTLRRLLFRSHSEQPPATSQHRAVRSSSSRGLQSCCRAGLPFSQRAGCEGTE